MLNARKAAFEEAELSARLAAECIDVTLPGRGQATGGLHPITRTLERIEQFFTHIATVLPKAQRSKTTTTTSKRSTSLATTRRGRCTIPSTSMPTCCCAPTPRRCRCGPWSPPSRPSALYARAAYTAVTRISPTRRCSTRSKAADRSRYQLRRPQGTIEEFLRVFFEKELAVRFRPSFFPFTEPSAEVDIQCVMCSGNGCRVCKQTGWLEVMGCGMVHPSVLRMSGIDLKSSRLRLRHGRRAPGHAALWRQRFASVLRQRPAVPCPIPLGPIDAHSRRTA